MITGEVYLHLPPHRNRAILERHHHRPRGRHGQNGAGAGRQNRIKAINSEHSQVRKCERARAVFLRLELLRAGPLDQIGPLARKAVKIALVGVCQHWRNQAAVLHGHGHRHVDCAWIGHAGFARRRIHLGMAGQGERHGLGQQCRHRHSLRLHQLIKSIQLVGADGVTHPEAGHRQAGHHVAVDRLLQGVESHGLAGAAKSLARRCRCRSRRCRRQGHSGRGWATGGRGCAFGHSGHTHRLASGLLHIFGLDAAMGATAPQAF